MKKSKWLPAEYLVHAQDMVCELHVLHPNQPKPMGWGMQSCPGAGHQNANAARIYMIVARAPMLAYG
jgi:hypothetical protein